MSFSYSQLATYGRCPKQYEFAYTKKVPRAISAGESFGSSIHNTLKRWGELEMRLQKHDAVPAVDGQLTLLVEAHHQPTERLDFATLLDLWNTCFIAEGHADRALMGTAHSRGKTVLQHFFEWWQLGHRHVIGIEKGFKISLRTQTSDQSTMISGRLDRIEDDADGKRIVIDYKTSQPRPREEIDHDLQISLYALACEHLWHRLPDELVLLFLNESGVTEMRTTRNAEELAQTRTIVTDITTHIHQANFVATPSQQKCIHCPYRSICPDSVA